MHPSVQRIAGALRRRKMIAKIFQVYATSILMKRSRVRKELEQKESDEGQWDWWYKQMDGEEGEENDKEVRDLDELFPP